MRLSLVLFSTVSPPGLSGHADLKYDEMTACPAGLVVAVRPLLPFHRYFGPHRRAGSFCYFVAPDDVLQGGFSAVSVA